MMWETARPYFYFRTTPDGRILAGGMDEDRADPGSSTVNLRAGTDALLAKLSLLFPDTAWVAEHAWCGTFGESEDELPFLGEDSEQPGLAEDFISFLVGPEAQEVFGSYGFLTAAP